jgi:hydroxyethylthiazole kinase-like uncharacterized protein yjeF
VVADADALSALDRHHPARPGPLVLTPHQAEFRRLAGEEATPEAAASLASALEAVVLLKGNPTWVTDGSTPWAITSGGPELATIGTGDVLAGMIAALLAGGLEAEVSARSAAYWHGRAGAMLAGAGTVTAADLVEGIGRLR